MDERFHGEVFIGYTLRQIEERQARIEATLRALAVQLTRTEKKIDTLAQDMTPAERAAVIATINENAAKVNQITDSASPLIDKLNQTGVS